MDQTENKAQNADRKSSCDGQVVVVRALKEAVPQRLAADGNLIVSVDDTYGVAIVYAYCSFKDYLYVHKRLFRNGDPPKREAVGYCSFGEASCGGNAGIVWINDRTDKQLTIATAVHEISHVVDDILESAGVSDKSGEARAYMVERETKRILKKFYGIRCHETASAEAVMEAMK
jgi:hypothetical protein